MHTDGRSSSLKIALWSIAVVVVALGAIILVKVNSKSDGSSAVTQVAPAGLVAKITGVADKTFTTVGKGSSSKSPNAISGADAYTKDGKPAVLYVGAEYCPYCATERWPMVIALSRFGTFSNLGLTSSSATDAYPSTATFSFHGATYTSKYLSFTGVEETTNQPNGSGGYTTLDTPTSDEQALLTKYDAAPYVPATSAGSIPFIYFGGKYLMVGSGYDPSVLQGKTADQIGSALSDTSSAIAKGVIGQANAVTATICQLTSNEPANVCQSDTIKSLQSTLGQ